MKTMGLVAVAASWIWMAVGAAAWAQNPPSRTLVLVAGKPSHPPRMHEFNAGVQLLAQCLRQAPGLPLTTRVVLNGWPADERVFDGADAVVFYMDGGARHDIVQDAGRRLAKIDDWARRGVGIGCMHYAVEVVPDQAGEALQRWIGGYYEHLYSCNPIWEPQFTHLPEHPVTRGVRPFTIRDEWYFNMRFLGGGPGNQPFTTGGVRFTPVLVATPSDQVRDGPYVYPRGPYPHIQAAKGRAECMLWLVERPDGGRGFGFTGGHFHDNWGNDDLRKLILNTLLWVAKVEVPPQGVPSRLTAADLDANLDPKPMPKAKAKSGTP